MAHGGDMRLLQMSASLINYPFAHRLYPHALDVIKRLNTLGPTVILSDGDVVPSQPVALAFSVIPARFESHAARVPRD